MSENHTPLSALIAEESARPASSAVHVLAEEIRLRHGAAVTAILFYGSCLRKQTLEGVLDFYVLVDSYQAAYASRILAWLNAALPPNVFYIEVRHGQRTLRAKYAVISSEDFYQAATPRSLHAIIWGRFCQPFVLVHARDENARTQVIQSATEAMLTFVSRTVALLPSEHDMLPLQLDVLWQKGFQETYRSELRAEHPETIRSLYAAAPERYDRVTHAALAILEQRDLLRVSGAGRQFFLTMSESTRRQLWNAWRLRLPLAKTLYALRLLKSAFTFGDWLPYALWKLQRHTGVHVELSERQRKHPLIWGWPVIFKLLARRDLR
jgi:hypothetical protein